LFDQRPKGNIYCRVNAGLREPTTYGLLCRSRQISSEGLVIDKSFHALGELSGCLGKQKFYAVAKIEAFCSEAG
jgi:hypothetical protein